MAEDDFDRELARRLREIRRSDDDRAPSFRGVLDRPRRPRETPGRRRALVFGAAAAAIVLAMFVLRPSDGPVPAAGTRPANAIAEWTSPTGSLLETPGNELYGEPPATGQPVPDWALELEHRSPGTNAPSTPVRKGKGAAS